MRSCKIKFGLFSLAFLLGPASLRAQLPQETTQPPVPGKDSTNKATLNKPQQPAPTPAAGTVTENPRDGLRYVWIPPGTFMMGCSPGDKECFDNEQPLHQVTITKGFLIGQTVVTVGAYQRFASATGRQMPTAEKFNANWADQNMPIVNVNWDDSQAYCEWSGGRLPTEAEWEYAARAGTTQARYGPLKKVAWYWENTRWGTHDVAQKQANAFGLYDTLGTVWEWVSDWFDENYYQTSPSQDPTGPSGGQFRVLRGGAWYELARNVRVSSRNYVSPWTRGNLFGVRCVGEANAIPKATLAEAKQPAPAPAAVAKPSAPLAPAPAPRAEVPQHTEGAPSAGTVTENPRDGLKYVWIPPGTFMMGCSPGDSECDEQEKPSHQVTITRGFWMGQTPVTVGAYRRFALATGRQMPSAPDFNKGWGNQNMPVVNVNWDEAQAYCQWVGGRLPTEAEWEYAARGGSTEARYGDLDQIAWYADNSGRQRLDSRQILKDSRGNYFKRLNENGNSTHEVALKRANGFGLYDTLGNVWEWVNDWADPNYYRSSPSQDPSGPSSGQGRVLRGGSWGDIAWGVRVSLRKGNYPAVRTVSYGLRCVGESSAP